MPLLRLSNGRVYTAIKDINRLVAPLRVGRFKMYEQVVARLATLPMPLSQDDAMLLLESLDPSDVAMVEEQGFKYRRVGNVVPPAVDGGGFAFVTRYEGGDPNTPAAEMTQKAIADYLVPHHVQANDWHFVFSGAIVKGVQLDGDLQGVVYAQAGDWIRLGPRVLNWPIFPFGEATAAVSFFDRDPAAGEFAMDLRPAVKVRPEMLY